MNDSTRLTLVVVTGLPGGLVVGFFGWMSSLFLGETNPFAAMCGFIVLVFGGACVGASPGLILGLFLGLRWVLPFLGAAAGVLVGFAVSYAMELTGVNPAVHLEGLVAVGFMAFGFCVGERRRRRGSDLAG